MELHRGIQKSVKDKKNWEIIEKLLKFGILEWYDSKAA